MLSIICINQGLEMRNCVLKLAVLVGWLVGDVNVGLAQPNQGLSSGFYSVSCPNVQTVVANAVAARLKQDPTAIGPLLRIFFHDCFVRGCDASVMIKSTANNSAERDSAANQTLREFALITAIKLQLEQTCPRLVSCADIVALTAKEAVFQSGGPNWEVELGRKDGSVSRASDVDLPSSLSDAQALVQIFSSKGFTIRELVTLSGAHTIGGAHCFQAASRFYNFSTSPNGIDPTLDTSYAQRLRAICHLPFDSHARVPLDASTPTTFDNAYFQNLLLNKGLFKSDSSLVIDSRTKPIVQEYALNPNSFSTNFVNAMIHMGRLGVLLGNQGVVRRNCESIN